MFPWTARSGARKKLISATQTAHAPPRPHAPLGVYMSKEMVISANPHETRVAIMEEGQLCEYYVERDKEFALVGSIYKGRVTRVLPGMQSSFVEIGLDSDAFLYVTDFLEGIEELDDHVAATKDHTIPKLSDGAQTASVHMSADSGAVPAFETASDAEFASDAPHAAHEEHDALGSDDLHDGPGVEGSSTTEFPPARLADPTPSHAAMHNSNQSHNAGPGSGQGSAPGRDRYENRGRQGGRDFGRRSGGGGNRGGRFGRRGGSGGGRSGGGREGAQRFGRELPSSKYASSRPYEAGAVDSTAPEGHVSIILPGESLAKYKDKPPVDPAAIRSPEETPSAPFTAASDSNTTASETMTSGTMISEASDSNSTVPTVTPAIESRESIQEAAPRPSFKPEYRESSRTEYPRASSSGLEPLPGETLSKWKNREPAQAQQAPEPSPTLHGDFEPRAAQDSPSHPELRFESPSESRPEPHFETATEHQELDVHEPEDLHEDHSTAGLSEDEVAALAEHVAEAQNEEAARESQDRVFAEADAAEADAAEAASAELDSTDTGPETEEEEHELAEEESDAEAEGMIGPSPEPGNELERDLAIEPEPIAAPGDASMPGENPAQQGQPQRGARVRDDYRARMQNPARRGGRDRGKRDDRGRRPQHGRPSGHGHPRSQPRRPQLIADMLKQGQEIIVQIAKEPLGKKGARITSHVALPGRFLVYMPTLDHTGVSRKIASAEDRARLRHLVNDAKGSAGGGFIVRTAAGTAAPEEVRADVEFLTRTWSEIKAKSEQRKAPSLLHRDLNLVERMLRDHMNNEYAAIWVDTEEEYTKVIDFMSRFQPGLVNRVKLYTKDTPVFEEFGIQQEIDKGLKPKVWLKSGGYIVINHTEALVAIDVNTGKFVGKGSNRLEDTIVRTNVEAVKEIVRQMRLRDLGGIIVIDFIDMEERRNREKVMAALEDALRADRAPSKVLRFNEFGLVAITRKRTKQALERTLCQPCPYCTGSGMVKSIPTLCYEIQTEARKMAPDLSSGSITLRVHPEIGKALKTRESSLIEELERWTKKSVIIQADPTLHWEQYDIY
jgi:Rne/Rng family ribonuclease